MYQVSELVPQKHRLRMSAPTMRSTSILTEHLQYPPISLVDDIINAVNEIMYKCTSAMEKYLLEKNVVNGKDHTEEIKIGIAKLETLLEHSVDKNFDKFELYTLRNVLRIPQELLDNNVFRLKHQENLVIANKLQIDDGIKGLHTKVEQIEVAFKLNSQLKAKLEKMKKLQSKVKKFKSLVIVLLECKESEEAREIFRTLKPLDDSMKLLTTKVRQLYIESEDFTSMEEVQKIINENTISSKFKNSANSRTTYIDSRVQVILKDQFKSQGSLNTTSSNGGIILHDTLDELNIQNPKLAMLDE